jgi:hypothetical protein
MVDKCKFKITAIGGVVVINVHHIWGSDIGQYGLKSVIILFILFLLFL